MKSAFSVKMEASNDSLSVLSPPMTGSPAVLLTPGRTRNIAQDMEALRLSRQDNPYLQQVMASRESLIESHAEECESDDTILMSQEFGSTALDFIEDDPLTLKEVHEHMIRSPPPTSCWPHGNKPLLRNKKSKINESMEKFAAFLHKLKKYIVLTCYKCHICRCFY
ncbi:hypothetical protein SFRURICE_001041 [Spodoptera frugiperda]|uniref:SFRICE_035348 n=1 Tax=Spodoptera frugiperda TaxID=7108 RepID=A0A2H1WWK1_SPOFR|nr:hypothetical protein SFRURICE_001041 [Spodoptera frugiperda]